MFLAISPLFLDVIDYSYAPVFAALGGFIMLFMLAGIVVEIFFLLTLQNTLKEVAPQHRQMRPGQVWLLLIPLFSIVWAFIVVDKMANSLSSEFKDRGIAAEARPGYFMGLTSCILVCCSFIPILGGIAALAALVFWIIYWVKINDFKNLLKSAPRAVESPNVY